MTSPPPPAAHATLSAIRRFLAGALLLGMVGTGSELLLIGHYESATQYAPLALLGAGLLLTTWHLAVPSAGVVRAVQLVMVLFVVSGGVGVALHASGNREFELELHPSLSGWQLIWGTLTGATPVLAPGSMTLLGLIGLAHSYRHPAAAHTPRSHQE